MTTFHHAYTRLTPEDSDAPAPTISTFRRKWHDPVESCTAFLKRNTGLLLVTASQAFLSAVNVSVKKLNSLDPPVPTLQLVFVRMAITYIGCIVYMLCAKTPDPFLGPKGVRWLLALRGFSGFFGLFGVYFALNYLSLSDATVLTFLAPLCTGVAGSLFLKEQFTRKQALAGICSLVGVVLIARPPFLFGTETVEAQLPSVVDDLSLADASLEPAEKGTSAERMVAVGVSLIGVLGATGAYTTIRAIGKRAHPLHTISFFALLCVIVSAVGMAITHAPVIIPKQPVFLLLLAQIGVFGFIAQILLTMGLQRETAGRGTMAVYSQIIFSSVFERIFFHSTPSVLSVVGTLIIIASALYVALMKEKEKVKDSSMELEEGLLAGEQDKEAKTEDGETREGLGKVETRIRDDYDDVTVHPLPSA